MQWRDVARSRPAQGHTHGRCARSEVTRGRDSARHYEAVVRVLVLARHDVRGSWVHLAAQLRHQGLADVRVVTFNPEPERGWPVDIADVFDGGQELLHLLRNADAFHFVDLLPDDVHLFDGLVGERIASGSVYVSLQVDERPSPIDARRIAATAARHGWPLVTTRPCTIPNAQFLAPFMPLWRGQWQPLADGARARMIGGERLVFASSEQRLRDTPRLESLVERAEAMARRLPELRIEVAVGRPHAHVLARRRRAHLVLVGEDGLGRDGLESLGQGIATVAELSYAEHEAWSVLAGSTIPIVAQHNLEEVLAQLDRAPDGANGRHQWALTAACPRRWFTQCASWWSGSAGVRAA